MTALSRKDLGEPRVDDVSGWDLLRVAIARYNDVPREEAIATLGTSHALWLAYASVLSPGDEVLVEDPGYEPLERAAEAAGARVSKFARPSATRFALDPERIARAMTPKTRVVAVTNLHNPTGARASDDVLRDIARLVESRGGYLLVDEVYAPLDDLVDDRGVFTKSARKLGANVLATSSLTKCYGLGNERVGWLLAPPDVITRAEHAIVATCGVLPLNHAHLGVQAFSRIAPLSTRARGLIAGKRERVSRWIASRPDLSWSEPDAGLFGFATVDSSTDLTPLIERAAEDEGVLVAAGSFFGVPNGFRLSWSIAEDKLDEALARLERVLARW